MNPDIQIKAFEGTAYKVEKHNLRRDSLFAVPKGALLLASDVVMDGQESVAEVWLAVPFDAAEDEAPQRMASIPPGIEAWPIEDEVEDDITVELLDGEEGDEGE